MQRDRRGARGRADHRRGRQLAGRVWVHSMDVGSPSGISQGDVVVVGNRADAQRLAIDLGAALLVISNGSRPDDEVLDRARRARHRAIVVSPLDTYVSGRMITLAAPCSAFMERDPLTVTAEYLRRRRLRADQGDPLRRRGRGGRASAARSG